jgi:quaternary ammonium compound-resistance protein SugE
MVGVTGSIPVARTIQPTPGLPGFGKTKNARDDLSCIQTRQGRPSRKMECLMAWISLFIAGLFEIGWAIGLKYTDGFSKLWPSVWTVAAMIVSLVFLEYALRTLPVGTAYAIWVGIGAVGTAIMGMWLFNESREIARIICLLLIVAGVIGLKFVTPSAS